MLVEETVVPECEECGSQDRVFHLSTKETRLDFYLCEECLETLGQEIADTLGMRMVP